MMNATKPYLQKVAPPFLLDDAVYDTLADAPPLEREPPSPLPGWTFARKRENGKKLPQSIAHRGYKEQHPENTMGAFIGAVEAGAHAIETDVHLTKDDVVVLSHDATLKRCFGKDDRIIDREWSYVREQRTLRSPHESMPRLKDLLEYLASPNLENIWLLLDIKIDNNANDIMRLIAQTIHDVPPHPAKPWAKRIVLGCWAAKFFPLCAQHLPAFPIAHIGFSGSYARQFLPLPNISFNILQKSVFGPSGRRLLRDVKAAGRPIYFWTVNGESMMRWSIAKEADGVITDDPKRFLEVCDEWEHGKRDVAIARGEWVTIIWLNLMVVIFSAIFWWRYGSLKGQQRKDAAKEVGEKKEEKKKGGKPGVSAIEHEEDQ